MSALAYLARISSRKRRGAAAVFVAVSMTTLLLSASLAVDVGYILSLRVEQQNNADAGALAGASGLQAGEPELAHRWAMEVIARNQKKQGYQSSGDQTIEFGTWDSVSHTFTPADDLTDAFAIRVRAARTKASLFFAAIIGRNYTTVRRVAVAVGSKSCGGIWGINHVNVKGSVITDSYSSADGPYTPGTAGDNGDVCSGRDVVVGGSYEVNGDVMAGYGYEVDVRGTAGTITGLTSTNSGGVDPPPIDMAGAMATNDNATIDLTDGGNDPFSSGWNLRIPSGDNLTLAPGTYYFESMGFNADGSLTVTGPTTIYLSGDLDVTGAGTINTTLNPADLTIYSTGADVKMTGHARFYGSIVAPFADVKLGGTADYFGAIVGGTVTIQGDFEFHVDESLEWASPYPAPPPMLVQ